MCWAVHTMRVYDFASEDLVDCLNFAEGCLQQCLVGCESWAINCCALKSSYLYLSYRPPKLLVHICAACTECTSMDAEANVP